jgi:hypothetical protein
MRSIRRKPSLQLNLECAKSGSWEMNGNKFLRSCLPDFNPLAPNSNWKLRAQKRIFRSTPHGRAF